MTVRVLDIETTGIDPATDEVCEIASVDVHADGTISNQVSTLVRPPVPMPAAASAIHHLIDEDLLEAPSIDKVFSMFQGADAYVAHNCAFEAGFLGKYLSEAKWVCTYKVALRAWPDLASHANQNLRYGLKLANPFGIERSTLVPHRALSDAIVTAAIFVELAKVVQWPDMVRWSREPALHTRFSFGKHRGKRFDEAPRDYLEWMLRQQDMDEGARFSAEHWLSKQKESAS